VELERERDELTRRGIGVAAISYDSIAILKAFAERRGIGFPLLSDPGSAVIRSFGLLNPEYPEGNLAHGVPYPGSFLTDAKGVIRAKYFEKTYAERRTAGSILALAGAPGAGARSELLSDHFRLTSGASNAIVSAGQRVTLILAFELDDGMHAYAPGVEGYRPLLVRLDPSPLFEVHETVYPPSRPFHFAPLDETVPVFEGSFRVVQDVTIAGTRELADALRRPNPGVTITGSLQYQVCSQSVCYPPARLPLRWTLKLAPLDRVRAPERIRH
jgi:AhpC/TSA family/Thiol:disulfide interchange protein DsbD, N-terminal